LTNFDPRFVVRGVFSPTDNPNNRLFAGATKALGEQRASGQAVGVIVGENEDREVQPKPLDGAAESLARRASGQDSFLSSPGL
jgi:hypothetical protein